MESLQDILVPVPLDNAEKTTLWLIPAGQYLSENYYRQLNQLDWSIIFSEERDGVSFFQQFLTRIKSELNADFVIIDSRTGITESSGLCTQQLADEVVMLSSLSSESIRVTKHFKELIQNSPISKALGKIVDVKTVVSRVPKPDNLLIFKDRCCQIFGVSEDKLFFLFSCPALELNEFLAINEPEVNEELVDNYVKLFYALDLELAKDKIIAEIETVTRRILRLSPKEAEQKIKQLSQYQNWSPLQQQVFQAAIEQKPNGTWGSKFTIAARDGIFDAVMEVPGFIHPIDTPALFIQPEKGVNRQNWQIQPYKTNLKNLNLCQVPGNHWPFLTNPTEFNQTVATFLAAQT
jgi:MinD-like ATPase involved in chromosome partitioning or flagellar assembly